MAFFFKVQIASLVLLLCSACAGPSVINDPNARRAISKMKIYNEKSLEGKTYKLLGEARGESCRRSDMNEASEEAARRELINSAYKQYKADGLANVACESSGISLSSNCWKMITCIGDAIKFE